MTAGEARESGRVPSGPVLFASVASAGQINPLLAIADELSRRGVCDVWFISDEDARERVEAVGAGGAVSFVSPGERRVDDGSIYAAITDESLYEPITRGPMTTEGPVAAFRMFQHPAILEKEYPWMLAQIDTIRPSLMVIDVAQLPALDAAMTRQVPFILSVPMLVSGVFGRRLPWRYPTPYSGLPLRMTRGQVVANVVFRLRLMLALLTGTNLFRWARWRRRWASST